MAPDSRALGWPLSDSKWRRLNRAGSRIGVLCQPFELGGRERLETRFRGREPNQGLIAWTVLAASSQWLLRQQVPERPTIGAGGKAGE